MPDKPRDFSIDFFKGLTVIAIIFTHTVWWSGQSYVPNSVAQMALFLDVPLFFFLSGASATFAFHKASPFSGIVRLVGLFTLFYGIYALLFAPGAVFQFVIESLFVQFPASPRAEVVSGSTWFIPVFVAVYFLSYLIISHVGKKHVLPILCLIFLFFVYKYESIEVFRGLSILTVTPDYLFANLFFFLFGFYYYSTLRLSRHFTWFASGLLVVSLGMTWYHFYGIPLDMQGIKFPHQFPYVIASLISISLTMLLSRFIRRAYFINYFGKNALQFYLAQGIGSTLIYFILPHIHLVWPLKLMIAFLINIALTFLITIVVTSIFTYFTLGLTKSLAYIDDFSLSDVVKKWGTWRGKRKYFFKK